MLKTAFPLRIVLVVVGSSITLAAMLLLTWSVERAGTQSLTEQIGRTMAILADQVQHKIDLTLIERHQDLTNVADLSLAEMERGPDAAQALVDKSLISHPAFLWIGLVALDRTIVAAAGDAGYAAMILESSSSLIVLADQRHVVPQINLLPPKNEAGSGPRQIELAAPIRDRSGQLKAIAVAVVGWEWVHPITSSAEMAAQAQIATEVLIASSDGRVLWGPNNHPIRVAGRSSFSMALEKGNGSLVESDPDGTIYVTGFSRAGSEHIVWDNGLIVLMRQPAAVALAPLEDLRRRISVLLLLFAAHVVAFHWVLAGYLTAPLLKLAGAADRLRQGGDAVIPRLTQFAEVRILSESLNSLVVELNERQAALTTLSASLESQVVERTHALEQKNGLLAQATHMAELAIESKSRMLATASHDLRQPLHALNLFCLALKRRIAAPDAAKLVGQIEQSLNSLNTMLDEILHIARLDAGLVSRTLKPVHLLDIIVRIGAEFSLEADARGLRFNFSSTDCYVLADPALFETIVRNLMSNAFKFTRSGGVVLAARSRGPKAIVEVYDTGPGIEASRLEIIFHEFERSRDKATGVNEGLGLGLSIVERHAKLIDAEVSVRTVMGRGSRFSVALHKTQPDTAFLSPTAHSPRDRTVDAINVLLLDDNKEALEALRLDLGDRGANVSAFDSASSAARAIEEGHAADVAVVDYDLGEGLTGVDFLHQCRSMGNSFAALILTGRTDAHTLAVICKSDISWMTKPADADALAARIAELANTASNPLEQPFLVRRG